MSTKTKKKVDFYSGQSFGILNNNIVSNYMKGLYFNTTTKDKEILGTKVNKYNMQIISKINELNSIYRSLIIVDKVAIKVIEMSEQHNHGDSRNLYRLMHAQSGTIKFNKSLKKALKTYAIDRQQILNALNADLDRQEDRISRNKKLILDLFSEYGIGEIPNLIYKDTTMDIFEHSVRFIDEQDITVPNTDDIDEVDRYYNNITDLYVKYISDLASKNGVSFSNNISESLAKNREVRNQIKMQIKENEKQQKAKSRKELLSKKMTNENVAIQNDLFTEDSKLRKASVHGIRAARNMINELGGIAYYPVFGKNTVIFYMSASGNKTTDLSKIIMFKTKEEAEDYAKLVKEDNSELLKEAYYEILSLRTQILNSTIGKASNIMVDFISGAIEEPMNISEEKLGLRAVIESNGYDTDKSEGTVIIYTATKINNLDILYGKSLLICSRGNGVFISEDVYSVLMQSVEKAKRTSIEYIQSKLVKDSTNYKIERHLIKFNCKKYSKQLEKIQSENTILQGLINNQGVVKGFTDIAYKDAIIDDMEDTVIERFIAKINGLRELGYKEIYYIAEYGTHMKHYSSKVSTRFTPSVVTMSTFDNYNEALQELIKIHDKNGCKIRKVMKLSL